MKKLIILDRDGVINFESESYIKTPEEWQPIPGSLEAIAKLHQAGYTIAIATNQSGVARGLFTLEILKQIHHKMQNVIIESGGYLDINHIFFCPHREEDNCLCRKPKIGLFEQIEACFEINLKEIAPYFIGDSLRDLKVAINTGCRPILVATGYGAYTHQHLTPELHSIPYFPDLRAAVDAIIS